MKSHFIPQRNSEGVLLEHLLIGKFDEGAVKFQDVTERSTVQKYPIGSRLVIGERAFRYGKFGAAVSVDLSHPVINGNIIPTDGAEVSTDGLAVAGDTELVILDTGTTTRPANYYQGGYVFIYRNPAVAHGAANHDQLRMILASTAGDGTSITLTLDAKLTCAVGATVDVYPSLWSNMNVPGAVSSDEETFVGMPMNYFAANEYGWVQTWGPCNGHYNTKFPGEQGPHDREVVFNQAGEMITLQQGGTFAGACYQRAGFVIPCTKTKYGSCMVYLMIAP